MYKSLYDYVAQNYYKMSRQELKEIILEVLFSFSSDRDMTDKKYIRIVKEALEEVNAQREEDKIIIDWEE